MKASRARQIAENSNYHKFLKDADKEELKIIYELIEKNSYDGKFEIEYQYIRPNVILRLKLDEYNINFKNNHYVISWEKEK